MKSAKEWKEVWYNEPIGVEALAAAIQRDAIESVAKKIKSEAERVDENPRYNGMTDAADIVLAMIPAREGSPSLVANATGKPPALGLGEGHPTREDVARIFANHHQRMDGIEARVVSEERVRQLIKRATDFTDAAIDGLDKRLTALERDRATPPFMESYMRAVEARTPLDQRLERDRARQADASVLWCLACNVKVPPSMFAAHAATERHKALHAKMDGVPPPPGADELLREVVEAYGRDGLSYWFNDNGAFPHVTRALTAAREYVNKAGTECRGLSHDRGAPIAQEQSERGESSAVRADALAQGSSFPAPSSDAVAGWMPSRAECMEHARKEQERCGFTLPHEIAHEAASVAWNLIHTAYTAHVEAGKGWPPSYEWCDRVVEAYRAKPTYGAATLADVLREVGPPTAHSNTGTASPDSTQTQENDNDRGRTDREASSPAVRPAGARLHGEQRVRDAAACAGGSSGEARQAETDVRDDRSGGGRVTPTAHVAPGNGDVYRVKTKRQYSAHGLRIDEVMSDASERHVDSIRWDELLGQHKDYRGPCAHIPRDTKIERAARRVLSVFEVARSPHGAPSRVIEPQGATEALCALMDAVEAPTAHVAGGGETPLDIVLQDPAVDAGGLARAQLAEMHRLLAPVLEAAAFSPAHEKASDAIARLLGQWRSGLGERVPPSPTPPSSRALGEFVALEKIIGRISYSPCDGDDLLASEARHELAELKLAALSATRGEAGERVAPIIPRCGKVGCTIVDTPMSGHIHGVEADSYQLALTRAPSREGEKP